MLQVSWLCIKGGREGNLRGRGRHCSSTFLYFVQQQHFSDIKGLPPPGFNENGLVLNEHCPTAHCCVGRKFCNKIANGNVQSQPITSCSTWMFNIFSIILSPKSPGNISQTLGFCRISIEKACWDTLTYSHDFTYLLSNICLLLVLGI